MKKNSGEGIVAWLRSIIGGIWRFFTGSEHDDDWREG